MIIIVCLFRFFRIHGFPFSETKAGALIQQRHRQFYLAVQYFDLWFHTEAHRTKYKIEFRLRFDSENASWFVALTEEQLALVADDRFHGVSFC